MILVVGGAGYIGSHLCRLMRDQGIEHVVFDNFSAGNRQSIVGSRVFEGNLGSRTDLDGVFSKYPIRSVMHAAAYISVGESVRDPGKYFENNTAAVLTLLDAMRAHGILEFVFSSTAAIFGEPAYLPIDEDHPKAPASPYGDSKLMVERVLAAYDKAYGLRSISLRYFNASGAHPSGEIGEDHTPEEHLIPVAIQAARGQRDALKVFGTDYDTPDGTCVRDFIHVCDLASAHLLAVHHLAAGGGSRQYNLGNGHGFSVREVVKMVETVSGLSVPSDDGERRPGDPARLIASSERIRRDWGWEPEFPELETIVAHAWSWHQGHPNGYG